MGAFGWKTNATDQRDLKAEFGPMPQLHAT
jgi:hypothetical protein